MTFWDGPWHILRYSIDDLRDNLQYCRNELEGMLHQWYCEDRNDWSILPLHKRELMRFATREARPIHIAETAALLGSSPKHTRMLLQQLVEEGWLEPASGSMRITSYRVVQRNKNI